jgi:negative regulator of replication initiation
MGSYEGEGPKKFTVGFRGYKREPVDQYVERLHQWLLDSEARAENAVEAATIAVGERASEILRAALGAGDKARQEAESVKATAIENAKGEAEAVMQDAHRQIDALQQSIDGLTLRKDNVLSELVRLQKYLAAVAPEANAPNADTGKGDRTGESEQTITARPDDHASAKHGNRPLAQSA